jgi:hypothetical protein
MNEGVPDPQTTEPDAGRSAAWQMLATSAAAELKNRLGRYAHLSDEEREKLARRLRLAIDSALEVPANLPERVAQSVTRLQADSPARDPVALAWQRTRQRARRTAAIGAVTTVPAMAPGLGPALAAVGLVADWRFVAEQQRDLVLEIAALLGVELKDPTQQVRALFLASTASAFGATAAGEVVVQVLARQIARRSLARIVPGAGAVVAGALNYVGTVALGRAAIEYFAARAGIEVHGVAPHRTHPAMPWLRNQVVEAVESGGARRGEEEPFSWQDPVTLGRLSQAEREELLDLAIGATDPAGAITAHDATVLSEIAVALGFTAEELDAARRAAARDAAPSARRVARLMTRAREVGSRTTRALWGRASRLARGRRRRSQ